MLFELPILHQTLVQMSPPALLQPGSSKVCMDTAHCMHKYPADRSPMLPMFLCWVRVADEDLHYRAECPKQQISARGGLGKPFLLVIPSGSSHGIHSNHRMQICASLLLCSITGADEKVNSCSPELWCGVLNKCQLPFLIRVY